MAGETAQTAAESPYTVNSIGMLARMAAHGLGVAFVPAMAAEKYTAAGRLKRLLPAKTKCFIEFWQDGEGYGKGRLKIGFRRPLPLKAWWNQRETDAKRQADAAMP